MSQDSFPPSLTFSIKTNDVMYHVYQTDLPGKEYSDLTGRFLYRCSRGNESILVGCHFDGNSIIATPIGYRQVKIIKEAWELQYWKLIVVGVAPHTCIIDNDASLELKAALKMRTSNIN